MGETQSATELYLTGKTKKELISIIMKERALLREIVQTNGVDILPDSLFMGRFD